MTTPHNGYLMRFEDGPMASRHNVPTAAGTTGNTVVSRDVWTWPLPDRLCVLCHEGVDNVAMWPDGDPCGLPPEIVESPNQVVYTKVSESQLDDSVDGPDSRVMRGALYQLATKAPA